MFEVIVVGGGHAGCEAALAAARMGRRTLLLTMNLDQVAAMSCNPAIGGLAKGHLVREIDALGGEMGRAIDETGIQFRTLNTSKGPAVQAYRAQADRRRYRERMRRALESTPGLSLRQGMVTGLLVEGDRVAGIVTDQDETIRARSVILTTGTFLNGKIHIGARTFDAGRAWEPPSRGLTEGLVRLGFTAGRLKTGTCPRLDGRTIDYSKAEPQPGDDPLPRFSFYQRNPERLPQLACHIVRTTEATNRVIERNFDRSPLFSGQIQGIGPRYCPSIEDKVKKFPDRLSHQIFLEPEGLDTNEVYPNGLSTSLPLDVQREFLATIPGLERAEIVRPGYAIEYDFLPPTQLFPTLMTKRLEGLFCAGQINGTSGYEEAAAQGIVAGINGARYAVDDEMIVFHRHESYIGVLIDDLVTRGTEEPYRMFTSRAEMRLLLRQDNADQRLSPVGRRVGLLGDADFAQFEAKMERIGRERARLAMIRLSPLTQIDTALTGGAIPADGILLSDLLKRPSVSLRQLPMYDAPDDLGVEEIEQIEIGFRYEGYIKRQLQEQAQLESLEEISIPAGLDYGTLAGLSVEVATKLGTMRPVNLGQASRISGITPAAISILHVHLRRMA